MLATVALLAASVAAHADPYTYNLTFTSALGYPGGTGFFSVDSLPSATGVSTYDTLDSLGVDLDGLHFSIYNTERPFPEVTFTDGALTSFRFFAGYQTGSTIYSFRANELGYSANTQTYSFLDAGSISAALAPSAVTPEPAGYALLGTGLLLLASLGRQKSVF